MKIVGLTGSIAAGKSTIARILGYLGAQVIDLDKISAEVCDRGTQGAAQIRESFGGEYFDGAGRLDRKKLGRLVFSNPKKRGLLEEIVHPLVKDELNKKIAEIQRQNPNAVVIVEAPVLIESGFYRSMDEVWVVVADEETRISRLMARDGISREEALERISSQMPQSEKIKYADVVLDNSGNLGEFLRNFGDQNAGNGVVQDGKNKKLD